MPSAPPPLLRSDRLVLRRWRAADLDPFAALNADPHVMRYFPSTQTREESAALIERATGNFDSLGYGLWAVDRLSRADRTDRDQAGEHDPRLAEHVTFRLDAGDWPTSDLTPR